LNPRFQADNDLRSSIRRGVLRREPSIDFQSAAALGLEGVHDSEVLRLCSEQGRILITHDENSMPLHFRDFLSDGESSAGVLIVPQSAAVGLVIESIVMVWTATEANEWRDLLVWLPL
jgi:hypothetical protein